MPVFLVSFRDKEDAPTSGFMDEWGKFIKGPSMHVEIAFIRRGRPVYGFYLTLYTPTATYDVRTYANPKIVYEWYELQGVDESKIESFCMQNKDKISMLRMVKSAMPMDDNDDVARRLLRIPAIGGLSDPKEIEEMIEGTRTQTQGEFCASLSIRAIQAGTDKLNDLSPETVARFTANDAVICVVRKLGAIKHTEFPHSVVKKAGEGPTEDPEDPAWLIRSHRWKT